MDGKDGLILWTLGGAGVLLLYAAYANKSPRAVLATTLGTPAGTAAPSTAAPAGTPAPAAPAGTSTGSDGTGTNYLFDADGNMAGVVPAPYQSTPHLYIPPPGAVFNA